VSPPESEAALTESEAALSARPMCAEVSAAGGEPIAATASRVEHWLLVEHTGLWPYEPLDASVFLGGVRDHLADQLARLGRSRLLLIKQPGRLRGKGVRVVYGRTPERGQRFFTLDLERHGELLDLDFVTALRDGRSLGEPLDHPLLLVCTHGKRDRCCARYGQPLCTALHGQANPGWVWQASHVGGDRFAGNLVCMPEGLYFGRVGREQAGAVLRSYIAGRIELDHYRGRSCYAFPVQAAESHVRRATGLVGFHDLRLLGRHQTAADSWTVQLRAEVAGDVYEVAVGVEPGEEAYLTCRAGARRRARSFVARSHRTLS
jgi:hypothetical protein